MGNRESQINKNKNKKIGNESKHNIKKLQTQQPYLMLKRNL